MQIDTYSLTYLLTYLLTSYGAKADSATTKCIHRSLRMILSAGAADLADGVGVGLAPRREILLSDIKKLMTSLYRTPAHHVLPHTALCAKAISVVAGGRKATPVPLCRILPPTIRSRDLS